MKFCSHCGKEIMDEAVICVNCGCSVSGGNTGGNTIVTNPNDAPDTGFFVLGLLIPLIGLILYLVNKDKSPQKAKSAGKGALIGFCVGVAIYIIAGVIALASAL